MRQFLVLGLTALLILGLALLDILGRGAGASADALAGAPSGLPWSGKLMDGFAAPGEALALPLPSGGSALGSRGSGSGGSASMLGGLGSKETERLEDRRAKRLGAPGAPVRAPALSEVGSAPAPEPATRAWFPETFLFEPLVETDQRGLAQVPVKVPDRLTTWRVLGLAHSRDGAQAGAVASFLGTLPAYVDPVVPPFLYAGDTVRLPVLVVNTTDRPLASSVSLSAVGGTLSSVGGAVQVAAGGTTVQYTSLAVPRPGDAVLKATLSGVDAVERAIPVKPAGRATSLTRGGTLAAPRTLQLEGPRDALPGTESVTLRVFPGALGLVRSELSAAPARGGADEDAALLHLTGVAPGLVRALGGELDATSLRELTLLATQRAFRHTRAPSASTAMLFTFAAAAHPEVPTLSRLAQRLAPRVQQAQRPDGTCEGETGWTLQRLLVATADCVRAVRAVPFSRADTQRATLVGLKASGAVERSVGRVTEGYTAAALVAADLAQGPVRDVLVELVRRALVVAEDGSRSLAVESGVVRADGQTPSTAEATALAVLALLRVNEQDPEALDLGAHLLGTYEPSRGWGDGRTNLLALQAATALFRQRVPEGVKVTLQRDGVVVTQGTLDAAALQQVLTLMAPAAGSGGEHRWTVEASPPVPGLGFALTLSAHQPWRDEPGGGLELTQALPEALRVGAPADLKLTATVPAGTQVELELGLPAGVQPLRESLEGLVAAGQALRFVTEDGKLTLLLAPGAPGATFQATLRLVPTLAGTLQAGPAVLTPLGRPELARAFRPVRWSIAP